jgi:hypothetical protein
MVYAVVASERQFVRYGQMSALGQKRTSTRVRATSALPLTADVRRCSWNVRKVPQADFGSGQEIRNKRQISRLLANRPLYG